MLLLNHELEGDFIRHSYTTTMNVFSHLRSILISASVSVPSMGSVLVTSTPSSSSTLSTGNASSATTGRTFYDKARILSNDGSFAGAWLFSVPKNDKSIIPPEAFRNSCLLRLGLFAVRRAANPLLLQRSRCHRQVESCPLFWKCAEFKSPSSS
jgi:hypothetical protein